MIERPDLIEDGLLGADRAPGRELGGVERDHPRLDDRSTRPPRWSRWPPSCASRWRRCPTAPRSSSSSRANARGSHRRRPDRHVPGAQAVRGGSTARARRRRARRRASASTPARSCPVRPRPPATRGPARSRCTASRSLDLTAWWAGPSASAMLAALGADVDPRGVGHPARRHALHQRRQHRPRQLVGLQRALPHLEHQQARPHPRPRRGPKGARSRCALIEQCDLVVENYTPRVIEQFDLGWDVVHATNPRAVMVRMPAFGLDGPWRDRPGFAQTMEQVTGLAWLTGHVDDQPRIQRGPCDPNGGMHAVVGALVALELRDRTGVGSLVESTMFEAALNISAELIVEWTAYGNALVARGQPQPVGRAAGRVRRPTRPSGGWSLSVATDEQWSALVDALGRPDWADRSRARARTPGGAPRTTCSTRSSARGRPTSTSTRRSTCSLGAGVPAAPAFDARRTSEHPQFVARGYYEYLDHPVIGVRGAPVGAVPLRQRRPLAPHRGADARPAQPRDPHRPRPLRRGDRRPRGRRPDRHPTPRTLREQTMPPPAHRPICSTASPSSTSTPTSPSRPTRGPRACPPSLHDEVPHIERIDGNDVWMAAGERLGHPGYYSMAGYDGVMPVSIPKTFDEIPDAMYDADARLALPRRAGHPRPGALPQRRRLRERLLPPPRRHASSSRSACARTTTSSTTGAAPIPTGCSR